MRPTSPRLLAFGALLATSACGSDSAATAGAPDGGGADAPSDSNAPDVSSDGSMDASDASDAGSDAREGGVVLGMPIVAPPNAWTWVDFPTSMCDDGTPTGIGVNPSATSTNVLVFLEGGGACWDYQTCVTLNTSLHGPFGKPQFDALIANVGGTVLDRNVTQSPFKDYNLVFVPYCTGDMHAGSADQTYTSGGSSKTIHHRGRDNVLAYLARLGATFTSPGKLAVTGSSAGGGGAMFNYTTFRAYWPGAKTYLVDDSLPLFVGDSIPPAVRDPWYSSWNLGALVDPLCGTACHADLSLAMKALATRYPSDRMALLSSEQDQTIRGYYLLSPTAFQTALGTLATNVLEPAGFKHFYVNGSTHTMLGNPGSYTSNGTPLWTWLAQMIGDDAAWASTQ